MDFGEQLLQLIPEDSLREMNDIKDSIRTHNELKKELNKLKAKGEVPDRYPCYHLFAEYFIREDMAESFKEVALEFKKKNADIMDQLNLIHYATEDVEKCKPTTLFQNRMLNCMMNSAFVGNNEETRKAMLALYKKHYKREYNQIKRFRQVTDKDLLSICGLDDNGLGISINVSRLIVASELLHIEHDESIEKLYLLMKEVMETETEHNQDNMNYKVYGDISDEGVSREECFYEIRELRKEFEEAGKTMFEEHYTYGRALEFINVVLNQNGFYNDHISDKETEEMDLEYIYADTLFLLRCVAPETNFSYQEIQHYAALYSTATSYCKNMKALEKDINDYMYVNAEDEEEQTQKSDVASAKKEESHPTPITDDEREVLTQQIEKLQRDLHSKEQSAEYMRSLYEEQKKKAQKMEVQLAVYEHDRNELLALREHLYQMTEADTQQEASASIEEMIEYIKGKRVAIIGGHTNWVNKLKNLFPDYKYIRTKETTVVPDSILDNVEKAYFFTDTISHCTYNKFVSLAMKRNVPFGYIHSVNMNTVIRQIYEDMQKA